MTAAHQQLPPIGQSEADAAQGERDGEFELAAEVVEQTLRLAGHLRGRVHDALATAGLNESRYAVLRHVATRGDAGCAQVELASAMGQCESSICTLIDRMKGDGLIERLRCTVDRRRSKLHLTENGTLALVAAKAQYAGACESLQRLWGDRTLEPMRGLLEGMLFELERPQHDGNAPATRKAA